jgi:hypothetical protein
MSEDQNILKPASKTIGVRLDPESLEMLHYLLSVSDITRGGSETFHGVINLWAQEEIKHKRAQHPRGGGRKPTSQSVILRKALYLGLEAISRLEADSEGLSAEGRRLRIILDEDKPRSRSRRFESWYTRHQSQAEFMEALEQRNKAIREANQKLEGGE